MTALIAQGIELRVQGDRLRFRPRSAMTPALIARLKTHKPALLSLLAVTKTPTDAPDSAGFGDGDSGDVLPATSYTASEIRMLTSAPAALRAAVESLKRALHGADVVSVRQTDEGPPPDAAEWPTAEHIEELPPDIADLAGPRDGWTPKTWRNRLLYLAAACETLHPDRAADLRRAAITLSPGLADIFEERAAIMEYDADLSRSDAEAAAAVDTLRLIEGQK